MTEAFADLQSDSSSDETDQQIRSDLVDGIDMGSSTRGKLIPFSYYGGKYKHLNWLLPLLPSRKAYVEPFGGSGVVLLNREPSDVETFNDLHSEVTNFFATLREHPTELFNKITLSPYSEEDFEYADETDLGELDDIERARLFFLLVNQTYNNHLSQPSWSYNTSYSSRGVSKKISNYQAKLRRLQPIADRLSNVQVTNRDAIDVIETFDTDDGLIYCDPPYPHDTRKDSSNYVEEMTDEDHRELASVLRSCEADVALSSYQSELYEDELVSYGWDRHDAESKGTASTNKDDHQRQEVLYVNYDVTEEMLAKSQS